MVRYFILHCYIITHPQLTTSGNGAAHRLSNWGACQTSESATGEMGQLITSATGQTRQPAKPATGEMGQPTNSATAETGQPAKPASRQLGKWDSPPTQQVEKLGSPPNEQRSDWARGTARRLINWRTWAAGHTSESTLREMEQQTNSATGKTGQPAKPASQQLSTPKIATAANIILPGASPGASLAATPDDFCSVCQVHLVARHWQQMKKAPPMHCFSLSCDQLSPAGSLLSDSLPGRIPVQRYTAPV